MESEVKDVIQKGDLTMMRCEEAKRETTSKRKGGRDEKDGDVRLVQGEREKRGPFPK